MAYVAARGGEAAIQNAEAFYRFLNGEVGSEFITHIENHLPYLLDRIMGEGSLYAPELAALAIAQTGGDLYESVLLLRAYRSTQPRLAYAEPITETFVVRRISAAFKDIPGGQILGPTLDYSHRVLRFDALRVENPFTPNDPVGARSESKRSYGCAPLRESTMNDVTDTSVKNISSEPSTTPLPTVAEWLRGEGLVSPASPDTTEPSEIPDVTRDPIQFPAPRAHRLQTLARADTGGILALGYSGMRSYGFGGSHPTVNEVRLAYAEVHLNHPVTGETFSAGRVRVSQAEVVSASSENKDLPELTLGFAMTLGWNEVKLIAAAMLDLQMNLTESHPAHTEEFVLEHTEPVESSGFCIHYKLPHYVTFQSKLDRLRSMKAGGIVGEEEKNVSTTEAI
jgi:alpha-D-ribose 1-methylphosphonate 5-triphosphate synthase subunit PhnI